MSPPRITSIRPYRFGVMFTVEGSTGKKYIVDYNFYKGWVCDCPDHIFRHRFCKHMQVCKDFLEKALGQEVPVIVWYDNPKADMVFEGEVAI